MITEKKIFYCSSPTSSPPGALTVHHLLCTINEASAHHHCSSVHHCAYADEHPPPSPSPLRFDEISTLAAQIRRDRRPLSLPKLRRAQSPCKSTTHQIYHHGLFFRSSIFFFYIFVFNTNILQRLSQDLAVLTSASASPASSQFRHHRQQAPSSSLLVASSLASSPSPTSLAVRWRSSLPT